jgi:hypothetical protein
MSIASVIVDDEEYSVAPLEPEKHDRPSPAYPMAITPEVARSWLRYNFRNRNLRANGKRDYATDIAEERYDINGTTVTFSRPIRKGEDDNAPEGSVMLIDGQHRLEACIKAGKPFVVYVAYGIKPEARRTVDTGIKRNLGDVFAMDGETNAIVLASVTKRAFFWSKGDKHLRMREDSFTHQQAQEFLQEHPELRRSTEITVHTKGQFSLTAGIELRQSVAGLAHWLFMKADETMAPEFFARLGDNAGIGYDHPVSMLRRRLIKDKKQKVQVATRREMYVAPDWQVLCYYIRSWNQYLAGPQANDEYPTFALVGANDAERMPDVATPETVAKMRIVKERDLKTAS